MLLYQKRSAKDLLDPRSLLAVLWQNRRLLLQFSQRNIEAAHRGTALGVIWSILSPLLLFATYAFVFGVVFRGSFGVQGETRADFVLGLFLGLSVAQFFLETLTAAPLTIVQNPNYVKKVVFPMEILPAAAVCAALFRCVVSTGLVLLAVVAFGKGLSLAALWILPLLATTLFLSLGVAWFLAAIGVFVRDLLPFMQFASAIIMFMSAVFYPSTAIPGAFSFLHWNPLLIIVESARGAVLWNQQPELGALGLTGAASLAVCGLGFAFFTALKTAFSDVL